MAKELLDILGEDITAAKTVICYENSSKGLVANGWVNPGWKIGQVENSFNVEVQGKSLTILTIYKYANTFFVVFDGDSFLETGGTLQPIGGGGTTRSKTEGSGAGIGKGLSIDDGKGNESKGLLSLFDYNQNIISFGSGMEQFIETMKKYSLMILAVLLGGLFLTRNKR